MRSSSEWKVMTTTRPPTASASSAAGSARSRAPSSSLTSMRSAWNVRLAGWPPVRRVAAGIGVADQLGQPGGVREGLPGPLALDRGGDPGGEPLLAVDPQHAGEVLRRVGVDDVGGGARGGRVHPHVQRGVGGVAEAALGPVELQRGDAEVEQHALHLGDAEPVEDVGQLVEDGGHEGDPVAVAGGLDPAGGLGAGVGVAVEADQPEAGVGVEHRQRVAGQAEGGVDEDGAVGGAGGGEEFGDALEQDGHVHRGPGAGRRGRSGAAHRRLPLEVRVVRLRWCRARGARRWDAGPRR